MKPVNTLHITATMVLVIGILFLVANCPGFLRAANANHAGQTTQADRDRELNERDLELRSWNLKLLSLSTQRSKNSRPRMEQAVTQLQDDFKRIQILKHPKVIVVASREQLKWSVLRLVKLVFSFVDNPFFKEASVVDTRVTAKARRDLEGIIKLSDQLKKDTEKLDKARQKGDH